MLRAGLLGEGTGRERNYRNYRNRLAGISVISVICHAGKVGRAARPRMFLKKTNWSRLKTDRTARFQNRPTGRKWPGSQGGQQHE